MEKRERSKNFALGFPLKRLEGEAVMMLKLYLAQ